jgi:transcriptional regulator with XRE-family HTH domain
MNLKKLRQKQNLKQKDVANILGYSSPQFISNWERGISFPPPKCFHVLAKTYNIKINILMQEYLKRCESEMKKEIQKCQIQ